MTGLHVYRSNRLEALAFLLAEQLRIGGGDPFRPFEIVVGSRGMERHLRQVLAEQLGLCANINFPFPNAALDALVPDGEKGADPWSTGSLTWALLEVLPSVAAEHDGGPLRRYLEVSAGEVAVGARTWGLAQQVADTFDGYITHRPHVVAAWSRGELGDLPPAQRWQGALWQAVRAHLGEPHHRSERFAMLDQLEITGEEQPLHIFGLSAIPGSWLQALGDVARTRPVQLYLLCPSDQYWADLRKVLVETDELAHLSVEEVDEQLREAAGAPSSTDGASEARSRLGEAGHPLLVSWGRTGRDLQILLESLPDGFEDQRTDLFLDPRQGNEPNSALHLLQSDIVQASHPALQEDRAERFFDPEDPSIQLHSCHGPTRQVEELRTVLLELLDDDDTLHPRDIVVMTPDIDAYAPLIGAVFEGGQGQPGRTGWFPAGSPRLPWELADLAVRRLNPVADALIRVLELVDGRAMATEVLDLLALEPVAERFQISAEEQLLLRDWVVQSGIRWGKDAEQRAVHEQPDDPQNTWRFGLERLLFGVMMADDGRMPVGIRPFDSVEGAGTRLVGQLADFCAQLFDQIEALRQPRCLADWVTQLEQTVEALTLTTGEAAWLTRRVREEITSLGREAELSRSQLSIGVDALRTALSRRFDVASTAHHGAGGAITFCGMVPERAVPYRVVCLLGMDEGSFPRLGARSAFDLLQLAPKVGDRNLRDEDRYLLLEAVLSARDHLIVFYTGRDVRTNEERPPAIPVSELRDALDATWLPQEPPASEQLTREHTLQPFDPRNFGVGRAPWSYDAKLLAGVEASLNERIPAPPFLVLGEGSSEPDREAGPGEAIDLNDVVAFWRHPLRAYLQRTLHLRLERDGVEDVPDREPLELGWIEQNELLHTLLEAKEKGLETAEVRASLRATGTLPLGMAGEVVFRTSLALAEEMVGFAERVVGWRGEALSALDVDAPIGDRRLVGRVAGIAPGALVLFAYGGESTRMLLEAWILLVAMRVADPSSVSRALILFGAVDATGSPDVKPIGLELPEDVEAEAAMGPLLAARERGLSAPLPFFLKTSHAVAGAIRANKGDVMEEALKKARSRWAGGFSAGEGEERYHRHAFGGAEPFVGEDGGLLPEVVELAVEIWDPILAARRTAAKVKKWGKA